MNWKKGNKDNNYPGDQSPSYQTRDPKKEYKYQYASNIEKSGTESGSGEMIYIEPTEDNYRRNPAMSPVTGGRQVMMRSPPRYALGQSILNTVRNDLNDKDTSQNIGKKPIPPVKVKLPSKYEERLERSPKTINLGETEKETEYNMKTLQGRRSPKAGNMYQISTNEQGNVFLDPPMQSDSFHQADQGSYPSPTDSQLKKQGYYQGINQKEVQYIMNPREARSPLPGIINKMSPNKNIEDENSTDNKGYESQTQIRRGDKEIVMMPHDGDGMVEANYQTKNDLERVEDYIKVSQERKTLTDGEIKKLVKQITHGYDPRKGTEGRLISTTQTIMLKGHDEIFNDRYRVLQKMNKLSTILLSKNKAEMTSSIIPEERKTFDRSTLKASTLGTKDHKPILTKTPHQRFLFLSLAMLSSKGPHCEDRIILRKMRFDKGGVVDLAQDQKSKTKYTVKKVQKKKPPGGVKQTIMYNPKHREKAAKIMQGWWREMKSRYTKVLEKIIRIQSVWRGRWLRKYIYDIIYISYLHQRFCDILEKVMVSHVRPTVWEELFSAQRNIREVLLRLLMKDQRWSYLRLKPAFDRWRAVAKHYKDRNLKSKNLVSLRELNEEKLKELKKRFKDWVMRANLLKYIGKTKDAEMKKQKFFGVLSMMSGLSALTKRQGLQTVNPQLQRFLFDKIRSRAVRALLLKKPKYSLLFLRKYFNKWNYTLLRMFNKDLREGIFSQMTKRLYSKLMKNKRTSCFKHWRSLLPKNKETLYARGKDLLELFAFRRAHTEPVKALKEKEEYLDAKDKLFRIFGVKTRYIRQHWRDYIYKWRTQAQKIKDKGIKNKMYNSLLNTVLNKRRHRILSNRFSKWRKIPKLDLEELFRQYKAVIAGTETIVSKALYPTKLQFMERFKKTIAPKEFKNAISMLVERYINKDRLFKRYFLYKWREQCKNYEIHDLKIQLFKYICGVKSLKTRKGKLTRSFNNWKSNTKSMRLLKSANKNYKASEGLDKLKTLFRRNPLNFMTRLHKMMNKDYRPKYIQSIANRLFKPRATPRDCFTKWRRVNEIMSSDGKVQNLKGQILKTNAHRLHDRINRDRTIKGFFRWLNQARNPENYYPKISEGINKLNHAMKKTSLTSPLSKLKVTKNYARRIVPLLKSNKKLQDRLNKDFIRLKLSQWKKYVSSDRMRDLKSNVILRTKNNVFSHTKGKVLTKYFTKWKVYRRKGLNPGFFKGIEILTSFYKKPYLKTVLTAYNKKLADVLKRRGINTLFGTSKTYQKRITQKALHKWHVRAKMTDPNRMSKLMTKMRLYIKDKEMKPIEKGFKRWLRALVKNPDFVHIVEGSDALKRFVIKKNRPVLNAIKNTISKSFIQSKLLKNVLPNSKLAKSRVMRSGFDKWLSKSNKLKTKSYQGALLSKVYNQGRGAVRNRIMRTRFKKWTIKEPERKPIDLFSAIRGHDLITSMLSRKYLQGFYPKMKAYGTNKFLRSLLMKSSKYELRKMKPIFSKWRTQAKKLLTRALTQGISSKIMTHSKNHQLNSQITKLLTDKISQWRLTAKYETKKMEKGVPDAVRHIQRYNLIKNIPSLIERLKKIAMQSKKTQALRSLLPKREKCDKNNLKNTFSHYKKKVHQMQLNDIRDLLKRKSLSQIIKKLTRGPFRYFLTWRNKAQIKHSDTPITLASNLLRLAVVRPSYLRFVKIADMLNLHIPRGISVKKALVNKRVNIAKSIALRNWAARPVYNKWKQRAFALKQKMINRHIFNTIISEKLRNGDILMLRRANYQWKDQMALMRSKEKLKELRMRIMSKLYDKHGKAFLKRFFDRWGINADIVSKKLEMVNRGMHKLRAHANRPTVNQMRRMIAKQAKFERIKAMLINSLRKNDRDNLAYCFNKWKKKSYKLKELYLKTILLRNLTNKQDHKSSEYMKNRLHEALLTWRIRAIPRDYFLRIERIRLGATKAKLGMRKPYLKDIYSGIKHRAWQRYIRSKLHRLYDSLDPKFNERLLRSSFRAWVAKLKDTDRLKRLFISMLNRYLLSQPIHTKLIKEPADDIVTGMQSYHQLKLSKALTIRSYCRGLLNIIRQFNVLKRNKFLHKQITVKELALLSKYNILFKKWVRTTKHINAVKDSRVIQRFLRRRLNNPADKRKRIVRGGELLDRYVKKVVNGKISKQARDNLMKRVMKRHIRNQEAFNKKMLSDRFRQWYSLLPYLRKHDAATVIENNYRNLRSRRKVDHMRLLNSKMRLLVLKAISKYLDKRKISFSKWRHDVQLAKVNKSARAIYRFTFDRVRRLLKQRAMDKLNEMFRMIVIKDLAALMTKASRIIGDKGKVMYRTLEDIYIRRPFLKVTTGMKWIGRISMLRRIRPMIYAALRQHYVPKTLRLWSDNTYGEMIRRAKYMQKWIRKHMLALLRKRKMRREALLAKYLMKLARDREMKLAIPFKIWDKRAKYDTLNYQTSVVQKIWKGANSRKRVDKLLNRQRLKTLFKKSLFYTIADSMSNADKFASTLRRKISSINSQIETRYSTNNLIDYANDVLRNKYLYILTGKRAYFDGLSELRRKFDKWRRINRKSKEAIIVIQNASRCQTARRRRRNLQRLRDLLLYFMMHAIDTDENRLNSAMQRWNLKARYIRCNHMSTVIQEYLSPKLERLLDRHFQNFFLGLSKRLAHRRLNQGGKVNALYTVIMRMNVNTFLQRLRNKDRADRLKLILAKKFHMLDDELMRMYKEHYLDQWRKQTERLNRLRNGCALIVQKNFKGYLARLFLSKLMKRRARMLRLLMKLMNDREMQKQIAFNLWRTNVQALKLDDSSRVIQDFMDDIKRKMEERRRHKRERRIHDGLLLLMNLKEIHRYPFNKIKSEASRSVFTQMNNSLKARRLDHLNTSLKAIKQREIDNLLFKLFKIPPSIRHRILHKAINTWKDNAIKLGRKRSAEMIQRNYRLYIQWKNFNNRQKHIRELLAHLTLKYSDLLRYYYNKWKKNANKVKVLRAGNKINRFVDQKFNNSKVKRNWRKLSDLLSIRDRNYGALHLMSRLKTYMACRHLINPIEHRIRKDGFDLFHDQIRRLIIGLKMQLIFNNFERRQEILALYTRFNHWRDQVRRLQARDEALEKTVRLFETRRTIIGADTVNSAFIIAKLFRTIPKIRAVDFYDRLRRNAEAKRQFEAFGKVLVQMKVDNDENTKAFFLQKVYRLYANRILGKMANATDQYLLKTVKPWAQRDFMKRLQDILYNLANFEYNNNKQSELRCPTTSLSFKARVINPKSIILNADNSNQIKKLMPYFVNYLEKKLLARKRDAYEAIRADYLAEKFCSLLKQHSNKHMLKPKRELYDELEKESLYQDLQGERLAKLFTLFRRSFIKKMGESLVEPCQIYKLMYCVRITVMHKRLAKQRYIREIVRKWRFQSFVKKMAKKKLEMMYKNLHVSYLQLANEVFGDEDEANNPSVVKEFERFGSSVGMFNNEEPSKGEDLIKHYYKNVSKRYVFESTTIEKEKTEAGFNGEEEEEIEENSDFYIDQDLGEGTTGHYRSETNKSSNKKSNN